MWLKGLRVVGEEQDVEEGERIDPHGGQGGFVCQGEDDACRKEGTGTERKKKERVGVRSKNTAAEVKEKSYWET